MSPFSASDAAVEGFRVLGHRWRVVAGWALFNLLGLIGACVLAAVLIGVAAVAAASSEAAGMAGGVLGAVVLVLAAFAVEVMIVGALYRMLLREGPPGFLYLRLGPDELRIGATWLIVMAAFLLLVLAGVAAMSIARTAGGLWLGLLAALAVMAVIVWLGLRLSLAAPIAVAERRLGFVRSWRLTKGRGAALLGMTALTLCLLALIVVVAYLALALISGAATGWSDLGLLLRTDADAIAERPGFYVAQLVLQFLFAPILWVIGQTPLAAAYMALSGDDQA
ncbi:hypothetical protein [Phenylobacterium sp. J367]|uniref:hypothetical protein n=1 Tax=Phenylobacterium sp. J367 TaxID=2898435 RepID=UPI002151F29C|nr:hypothetical protein [Phenylobacterium sp. J367]MCR5879918.1 hypothetical protein [Phenylobacterium sp. J367]